MALSSYALTSLERQKTFMGITSTTHDALLNSLINVATDFIENYCDRRFLETAYSQELYDGDNTIFLFLKQYPVDTAETFTVETRGSADNQDNWSTLNSQHYFVDDTSGYVERVDGSVWERLLKHYRITYTAGYAFSFVGATYLEDLGAGDLEYACWRLVTEAFNQRKGSSDVSSERIGEYQITFRKGVMLDEELKGILNKYKRPARM